MSEIKEPKIVKTLLNTEYADFKDMTKQEFNSIKEDLAFILKKIDAVVNSNNLVVDYNQDAVGRQDENGNTLIKDATEFTSLIGLVQSGTTLKLEGDADFRETSVLIEGKEVTLDLNGSTVTASSKQDKNIDVKNGKLTLTGGTVVTTDPYSSTAKTSVITVHDGGQLVVQDLKVEAVLEDPVNQGQFGISVFGNGKLIIESADMECGWYPVSSNGSLTLESAEILIKDGKYVSTTDFCIYHPSKARLTIEGGSFVGGAGALSVNDGNILITGGEFVSTNNGDTGEWDDGTTGQANAVLNLNAKYGAVTLAIAGGKFTAQGDIPVIIVGNTNPVTILITGGKFNVKPEDSWIVDGYKCTEEPDADGYYEVIEAPVIEEPAE